MGPSPSLTLRRSGADTEHQGSLASWGRASSAAGSSSNGHSVPRDTTDSPRFLPLSILSDMTRGGEERTTFGVLQRNQKEPLLYSSSEVPLSLARAVKGFGGRGEVSGVGGPTLREDAEGARVEVESSVEPQIEKQAV